MADIDDTRKNTNGLRADKSSQEPEISGGLAEAAGQLLNSAGFFRISDWAEQKQLANYPEVQVIAPSNMNHTLRNMICNIPFFINKDDYYWLGNNNTTLPWGDTEGGPVLKKDFDEKLGWFVDADGERLSLADNKDYFYWLGEDNAVVPWGDVRGGPVLKEAFHDRLGQVLDGNGEVVYRSVDAIPRRVREEYKRAGIDLERIMNSAGLSNVQDFNEVDLNLFGVGGQLRTDRFGHTAWGVSSNPLTNSSQILDGASVGIGVGNVITPDGRRLSPEELRNNTLGGAASLGGSGGFLMMEKSVPASAEYYPEHKTGLRVNAGPPGKSMAQSLLRSSLMPSASVSVSQMQDVPEGMSRFVRPVLQPKWNGLTKRELYRVLEAFKRNRNPMLKK